MSIEYQLLSRLEQVKTRVRDIRARAGLAATTPVLDRVSSLIAQRQAAGGGILARLRAPAPTPTPTPATQLGFVETQEELGIEAR
jgi:hypothetical protein